MKVALVRRGVCLDTSCVWCLAPVEDIEHLFFLCPKAQSLWRVSVLGFCFQVGNLVAFKEWLFN